MHSADSFLVMVDDYAPQIVRAVTQRQERYWDGHSGAKSLVQALQDAECPDFADRIREHLCHLPVEDNPESMYVEGHGQHWAPKR